MEGERTLGDDSVPTRRSGGRRIVRVQVNLVDQCGEPMVLDTVDIGPNGIFVRSDIIFEAGEELWVTMTLSGGPPLVMRGRVVRSELGETDRPSGMGIEFVGLGAREKRWLRWYTAQLQRDVVRPS